MMRIYCQYSIGGFKIFNVSAFKNNESGLIYVRMPEITDAKTSASQDLLVTRTCNCGLDNRIIRLFSTGDISLMILNGCGANKKDTTLFISLTTSKTSYAFVSDDIDDRRLFAQMATIWTASESSRTRLSKRLSDLVSEQVIGNEVTFAFDTSKWRSLVEELSRTAISPKLTPVAAGVKNLMVYNRIDKGGILRTAGINEPLTSFVSIPGNEELRKVESKKRLVKNICVAAGALIAFYIAANLLSFCSHH